MSNTEFKYDNKTYHLPSNDEGEYITLKLATGDEKNDATVEKVIIKGSEYVFVPNVITLISNDNNFSRTNSGSFSDISNDSELYDLENGDSFISDVNEKVNYGGGGLKKGGKYSPFFFKSFKSSKKNKKTKGRKGPRKLNTRRIRK